MPAPYRLIIRLLVALLAVAAFAVAYLIALALEAPNVPAAAARVSHAADPAETLGDGSWVSGGPGFVHGNIR